MAESEEALARVGRVLLYPEERKKGKYTRIRCQDTSIEQPTSWHDCHDHDHDHDRCTVSPIRDLLTFAAVVVVDGDDQASNRRWCSY